MRVRALACALAVALAVLGPLAVAASRPPAALVRDITSGAYAPGFWPQTPSGLGAITADLGGALLFTSWTSPTSSELWRSDGTPAGTSLVRDIFPGAGTSSIGWMTTIGGITYFSADDGSYGQELWRSDGTAAGTWRVADVFPGERSSSPSQLTVVGGALMFVAQGDGDAALWVSDGTIAGTRRVRGGFVPQSPSSPPTLDQLTAVGQRLFFVAGEGGGSGPVQRRLWVSDGAEAGTLELPGPPPERLAPAGARLVYATSADMGSFELWSSDGTAGGTSQIAVLSGSVETMRAVGDEALFTVVDAAGSLVLWRSDGTPGGTEAVRPLGPSLWGSSAVVGQRLVLSTYDGTSQRGTLWLSDGTSLGTVALKENDTGFQSLSGAGGRIYFVEATATGPTAQVTLWTSDGTVAGTAPVLSRPASIAALGVAGSRIFLLTDPGLWVSDGTPGAASLVRATSTSPGNSLISVLEPTLDGAYLTVDEAQTGDPARISLYRSDATALGTTMAGSFLLPAGADYGERFAALGHAVIFSSDDSDGQPTSQPGRLWRVDGSGVTLLANIASRHVVALDGLALFSGPGANGEALWSTDGTPSGTRLHSEVACDVPGCFVSISGIYVAGGRLWVDTLVHLSCCSNTQRYRSELWVGDGAQAGIRLVKRFAEVTYHPINSPWAPYSISGIVPYGAGVAFTARESGDYNAVWVSDGTLAGTRALTGVAQRAEDLPDSLTDVGGRLFFSMGDAAHGRELWVSDGTAAGTRLALDALPGAGGSGPRDLTSAGGALLFSANDGAHGRELWVSDGTAAGTRMLRDIVPGVDGSNPRELAAVGVVLLFSAADEAGVELWSSDGTPGGTQRMQDIATGPASSNPAQITLGGGHLFFVADDGVHGRELWGVHTESAVYGEVARLHLPLVGQ